MRVCVCVHTCDLACDECVVCNIQYNSTDIEGVEVIRDIIYPKNLLQFFLTTT